MSETTFTPAQKVLKVIDPADPGAEAAALAWDRGVISLTPTQLVIDDGGIGGEQTVDIIEGRRIVCLEPDGIVTVMSVPEIEANWGAS